MSTATPARPHTTHVDYTGASDDDFQARIAAFEAAEYPAEVAVERVAAVRATR